MEQKDYQGN